MTNSFDKLLFANPLPIFTMHMSVDRHIKHPLRSSWSENISRFQTACGKTSTVLLDAYYAMRSEAHKS